MTQFIDAASERELEIRQDALRDQAIRAGLRGKTIDDSAQLCRVCTDPIAEARRRALPGVQTCIVCQIELEYAGSVFYQP